MDPDSAPLVPECAFPSVVRIASHCTGTYVGNGVIVTAGHCMNPQMIGSVSFGDTESDSDGFSIDVEECEHHPDGSNVPVEGGESHYAGVDLGYCLLDDADPDYDRLASVAIAPVMVPTGCIRDWLAHELWVVNDCDGVYYKGAYGCMWSDPPMGQNTYEYPGVASTAVGMGLEGSGTADGNKRSFNPTFYAQGDNSTANFGATSPQHKGSPTQLITLTRTQADGTPILGDGSLGGDSGGPLFYQLPDYSWQQIGDLNGEGLSNLVHDVPLELYEAVPPWLRWLENNTGQDLTPCHDLNAYNEWVWHGDCLGDLPTSLDQDGGAWLSNCAAHTTGGAFCGGWSFGPPLDDSANPPMPNHPWIATGDLDAKVSAAEALAVSGAFGSPISIPAVRDYLVSEALNDAFYTFLAKPFSTGDLGAYTGAVATGDFDGDSILEEVFGEADHDCGKGRVIVEDANDNKTYWSLNTTGVLGTDACDNYLGAALAVADFDDDGYDDLAMSTPGEAVVSGLMAGGAVHILYGSSTGLTETGDQVFHMDTTGIGGTVEAWDHFGEALTTGDFNCDGYQDLAIGTPRKTIDGNAEAGSVHVFYGGSGGLTSVNNHFYEGRAGVGDLAEEWDHFGAALASGRFNGDACSDLAIGVPGEDAAVGPDAGQVHVLHGSSSGLPSTATSSLQQGSGGMADSAEVDDRFGSRLEVEIGASVDVLRILVPSGDCSDPSTVGWHTVPGSTSGLDLSNDAVECEWIPEGALFTADYRDLRQLATLAAVRVTRAVGP